jgi:hypothetical protein
VPLRHGADLHAAAAILPPLRLVRTRVLRTRLLSAASTPPTKCRPVRGPVFLQPSVDVALRRRLFTNASSRHAICGALCWCSIGEKEIERLMKSATENRYGHRDATMILLAYRHGFWASELGSDRFGEREAPRLPREERRPVCPSAHRGRNPSVAAFATRARAKPVRVHD